MNEKNASKEILASYKEMGQRDTLAYWRKTVPKEARKAWIKDLISDAGFDKLSGDFELWEEVILNNLPENKRAGFIASLDQYKKLAQMYDDNEDASDWLEERLLEKLSDVQYYITNLTNLSILEDFAKKYFTTFETDEAQVKEFFERQTKLVSNLKDVYLKLLSTDPALLKELALSAKINFVTPDPPIKPEHAFKDYLGAAVVYGSAAIGPRKKEFYPKIQDTDTLLIPNTELSSDPFYEYAEDVVYLLNLILEYNRLLRAKDESKDFERDLKFFPELKKFLDFLNHSEQWVDLHLPEKEYGEEGKIEDWKKLVGPHRVIYKNDFGGEATYKERLQKSIDSAK